MKKYRDDELIESFGLDDNERKKWTISFDKRVDNNELPKLIKSQLSKQDFQKVELEMEIFT